MKQKIKIPIGKPLYSPEQIIRGYVVRVCQLVDLDPDEWDSRIREYMAEGWTPVMAANYIRALRVLWPEGEGS